MRSRGLGDVYKRQVRDIPKVDEGAVGIGIVSVVVGVVDVQQRARDAVSYPHLTLPTIYSV